jgi:predicted alpha/beta hydrolase family esterase
MSIRNVQPDIPDLRDRLYVPTLQPLPPTFNARPFVDPAFRERVLHQGETQACTGFALASLIEKLHYDTWADGQLGDDPVRVSPFMLYYFARRYDELPGEDEDGGSTARGAMKAWSKHGACLRELWPELRQKKGPRSDAKTKDSRMRWISDAFRRPLGAYFRVDHNSIADMHAALRETGSIYVTAMTHTGWDRVKDDGTIPFDDTCEQAGGHAFLLVGYDEHGFWMQNSWGPDWANKGFARLAYRDWRSHSMDAWVAQVGVATSAQIESLTSGLSLTGQATAAGAAPMLSTNPTVSAQQINPYIINLENNGTLSDRGQFATRPEDFEELLDHYLPNAVAEFGLGDKAPIDIAIYCHGGLTPESAAAETARQWVPAIFEARIFPLFIMWETGWQDTIRNIFRDAMAKLTGAAGAGPFGWLKDTLSGLKNSALESEMWKKRFENLVSIPGTTAWKEMKENAEAATKNPMGGLHQLAAMLKRSSYDTLRPRLRFHLIGHSAGAVFHAHLAPALAATGRGVDGIYFMAPACRSDLFKKELLPLYAKGRIKSYAQFHLTEAAEQQDKCTDLYLRSLLYLVSNAFERGREVPILGMQKFFHADPALTAKPAGAEVWDHIATPTGPGGNRPVTERSNSTTHGGFNEDQDTMKAIIARITARRSTGGTTPAKRPPKKKR